MPKSSQGLTLKERIYKNLKNKLVHTEGDIGLNKAHIQQTYYYGIIYFNFLKIHDKVNAVAHKHWTPLSGPTKSPLGTRKNIKRGKPQSPGPFLTIGGFA